MKKLCLQCSSIHTSMSSHTTDSLNLYFFSADKTNTASGNSKAHGWNQFNIHVYVTGHHDHTKLYGSITFSRHLFLFLLSDPRYLSHKTKKYKMPGLLKWKKNINGSKEIASRQTYKWGHPLSTAVIFQLLIFASSFSTTSFWMNWLLSAEDTQQHN